MMYFDYFVLVIMTNFSTFLLVVKEAEKPLLTNQESNKCKSFNDISIAYILSIYTLHTYTIPTGVQSILSAQTPTVVDYSDSTPFVVLSNYKKYLKTYDTVKLWTSHIACNFSVISSLMRNLPTFSTAIVELWNKR